ncbi:hypothetical protein Tco_1243583 [Tanacetum coccineum]
MMFCWFSTTKNINLDDVDANLRRVLRLEKVNVVPSVCRLVRPEERASTIYTTRTLPDDTRIKVVAYVQRGSHRAGTSSVFADLVVVICQIDSGGPAYYFSDTLALYLCRTSTDAIDYEPDFFGGPASPEYDSGLGRARFDRDTVMSSDSASSEVTYTSISSHGDPLAWAVDFFRLQEPDSPEAAPASPDYVPALRS